MYYWKGKGKRLHLIEPSTLNKYNIITKIQKPIKFSQFSKKEQAIILKTLKTRFKYVPLPVGPRAEENKIVKKSSYKPKPKSKEKTDEERYEAYGTVPKSVRVKYGLKAGKKANVLATHPDKGGTNEAFRAVHTVYAGLSANPTEAEIKKAEESLSSLNLSLLSDKPGIMSKEESEDIKAARTPRQAAFETALEKWLEENHQADIAKAEELGINVWELPGWERVYESESFKPVLKLMPRKPKSVQDQIERLKQDIGRVIIRRDPRGPYKPRKVKTDAEKQAEEALKEIELALTPRVDEPTEEQLRQLEELKALKKSNEEGEKKLLKEDEALQRKLSGQRKKKATAELKAAEEELRRTNSDKASKPPPDLKEEGTLSRKTSTQPPEIHYKETAELLKLPSKGKEAPPLPPRTKSQIQVTINGKLYDYNSSEAVEHRKQIKLQLKKLAAGEDSDEETVTYDYDRFGLLIPDPRDSKAVTEYKELKKQKEKEEKKLQRAQEKAAEKEARKLEKEAKEAAEKVKADEAKQKEIRRIERAERKAREDEALRILRMRQQVEETAELARREQANREIRALSLPSDELGVTGNFARQQGAQQPRSLFTPPSSPGLGSRTVSQRTPQYEEPSTPGSNWGPDSPQYRPSEYEERGPPTGGNGLKSKIDFKHIKWGTLTEQYNEYNNHFHHKIPTLEAFAHLVVTHPKMFDERLIKKAQFYVNILEEHKTRK